MPVFALSAPAAAAFWGAVGTGASVGGQIYGAKKSAASARQAAQIEASAADKALAQQQEAEANRHAEWLQQQQFLKDQEAQRKAEYDQTEAQRKAAWDAEEARRAPAREAAEGALRDLARRSGVTINTQLGARSMPADWGLAPGTTPSASTGAYAWSVPQAAPRAAPMSSASSDASMLDLVNRSRQTAYTPVPFTAPLYRPQQIVWGPQGARGDLRLSDSLQDDSPMSQLARRIQT